MRKLLICFLGLLASCQTVHFDAGRGPLTLDYQRMRLFEMYAAHEKPLAFAVAESGKTAGFAVCNAHRCGDNGQIVALDMCRATAKERPCRLLAIGRDIVWQGPVSYETSPWLGQSEFERPVAVYWDVGSKPWGERRRFYGLAHYDAAGTAKLTFAPSKYAGTCEGLVLGVSFRIACSALGEASGSFSPHAEDRRVGRGGAETATRRFVEIEVLPWSNARRYVFQEVKSAAK